MSLDLAAHYILGQLIRERLGPALDRVATNVGDIALLNIEQTAAVMSLDRETVARICTLHPELVIHAGRAKRIRVAWMAELIDQGGDLLAPEAAPTPIRRRRKAVE